MFDQFRYAWTNNLDEDEAMELYDKFHVAASGVSLAQMGNANLNPWTEAKVEHQEPRPRSLADHRGREGPHRAVGDRECRLQAAEGPTPA